MPGLGPENRGVASETATPPIDALRQAAAARSAGNQGAASAGDGDDASSSFAAPGASREASAANGLPANGLPLADLDGTVAAGGCAVVSRSLVKSIVGLGCAHSTG